MAIWFISRHSGAIEWAKKQNLNIDRWETHLDPADVQSGDTVIGTLPVHLVAQVCAKGAKFLFLTINVSVDQRGKELGATEMDDLGCTLAEYFAKAV